MNSSSLEYNVQLHCTMAHIATKVLSNVHIHHTVYICGSNPPQILPGSTPALPRYAIGRVSTVMNLFVQNIYKFRILSHPSRNNWERK